MEATKQTFGVFTEVTNAFAEDGCPSITLYTARSDSMFGQSLSAYWSLTLEEAEQLGTRLIERVGRARQNAEVIRRERFA